MLFKIYIFTELKILKYSLYQVIEINIILLSLDYRYLLGVIAKYTYKALHQFLLLERWLER